MTTMPHISSRFFRNSVLRGHGGRCGCRDYYQSYILDGSNKSSVPQIPDKDHNGFVMYTLAYRRDRDFSFGFVCEDILDIGVGIGWVETDSFRRCRESDLPMLSTILLRERGSSAGERGGIRGPSEVLARVMTPRVFRTLHDRDLDIGFGGTQDTWSSCTATT